jgi:predicted DCC family thiol-disulfide oxidoreductase YuxK
MPVLLYDGQCRFCRREVGRLCRMVGDAVSIVSFHDPGVLERYPQLDRDQCMRELKLVHEDGRVEGGIRAVAGALGLSARWQWLSSALRAPLVRTAADLGYRAIARLRYRLMGQCGPEASGCTTHSGEAPPSVSPPRDSR